MKKKSGRCVWSSFYFKRDVLVLTTLRYVNATFEWFWHNCERAENGCRTLNYGKMRCRTPCSMLMLSLKDKLFFSSHVRRFLLLFIGNSLLFSNINKLVIFLFKVFFCFFDAFYLLFTFYEKHDICAFPK